MNVVARLVLGFLWLLSWMPLALQAAIGRGLGRLLWALAGSRRKVALRNLELTMPEKPDAERRAIARENFQWIARSILERGLLWHAPPERLRRLIHVEGDVGFAERTPGPVMWLVPHFVALDVAGSASQLFQNRPVGSIYQRQSIAVFDQAIRKGRLRFGNGEVFSRHEKALPLIRAIRRGYVFFNLPDMDFGPQEAAFVPFMGVPAATLLAPSKMARSLGMTVQPVVAEILPGGQGYRVRFLAPWTDFPTDDPVADAARMNEWIASEVRRNPSQYYWVHKRFKTRPPGEASLY
ncbi:MAG TPA: lipid A biosynthesis acyltransferase [Burkholderiaceae bacterium]|jgi:KDO2-lipid IV(A) lauroyltransferase|nr:lipid A biosynthesis acyltransferase [Burkholderiaceae bacterium]